MKTKIIPFDLEMAKKIQAGEIEGKILTSNLKNRVRILCYDFDCFHEEYKLVCAITRNEIEYLINYTNDGYTNDSDEGCLVLEVPDEEQQELQFKPFDKVLVRRPNLVDPHDIYGQNEWVPALFQGMSDGYFIAEHKEWEECISYEGNEHLVGTTDKPKEE